MSDNPDVPDCPHDDQTYLGTDTEASPEIVYTEWRCDDCGAYISDSYEPTGRAVIAHPEPDVVLIDEPSPNTAIEGEAEAASREAIKEAFLHDPSAETPGRGATVVVETPTGEDRQLEGVVSLVTDADGVLVIRLWVGDEITDATLGWDHTVRDVFTPGLDPEASNASDGPYRWVEYEVEMVAPEEGAADAVFEAIRAAGFAVRRVQDPAYERNDLRWGTAGEDYHK